MPADHRAHVPRSLLSSGVAQPARLPRSRGGRWAGGGLEWGADAGAQRTRLADGSPGARSGRLGREQGRVLRLGGQGPQRRAAPNNGRGGSDGADAGGGDGAERQARGAGGGGRPALRPRKRAGAPAGGAASHPRHGAPGRLCAFPPPSPLPLCFWLSSEGRRLVPQTRRTSTRCGTASAARSSRCTSTGSSSAA